MAIGSFPTRPEPSKYAYAELPSTANDFSLSHGSSPLTKRPRVVYQPDQDDRDVQQPTREAQGGEKTLSPIRDTKWDPRVRRRIRDERFGEKVQGQVMRMGGFSRSDGFLLKEARIDEKPVEEPPERYILVDNLPANFSSVAFNALFHDCPAPPLSWEIRREGMELLGLAKYSTKDLAMRAMYSIVNQRLDGKLIRPIIIEPRRANKFFHLPVITRCQFDGKQMDGTGEGCESSKKAEKINPAVRSLTSVFMALDDAMKIVLVENIPLVPLFNLHTMLVGTWPFTPSPRSMDFHVMNGKICCVAIYNTKLEAEIAQDLLDGTILFDKPLKATRMNQRDLEIALALPIDSGDDDATGAGEEDEGDGNKETKEAKSRSPAKVDLRVEDSVA